MWIHTASTPLSLSYQPHSANLMQPLDEACFVTCALNLPHTPKVNAICLLSPCFLRSCFKFQPINNLSFSSPSTVFHSRTAHITTFASFKGIVLEARIMCFHGRNVRQLCSEGVAQYQYYHSVAGLNKVSLSFKAPFSRSSCTTLAWPFFVARCNGVLLYWSITSVEAPLRRSSSTTPV